jgi:hypothetical protein
MVSLYLIVINGELNNRLYRTYQHVGFTGTRSAFPTDTSDTGLEESARSPRASKSTLEERQKQEWHWV